MVKLISSYVVYLEKELDIELEINGKKASVSRYAIQDVRNSDYDIAVAIKDAEQFTQEEQKEIEEFVKEEVE